MQPEQLDDQFQPKVRPPYVEFARKAVEDREATVKNGRFTSKDLDIVHIFPIGTKDKIEKTIPEWFEGLESQAQVGRIPQIWVTHFKAAHKAWLEGQEIPLHGTPIRGWAMLSPAQQDNIVRANVRTVEDLAQANEESLSRIGMGSIDLKNKAATWLKAQTGPGKLTQENVALKAEIENSKTRIASLEAQVQKLLKQEVAA